MTIPECAVGVRVLSCPDRGRQQLAIVGAARQLAHQEVEHVGFGAWGRRVLAGVAGLALVVALPTAAPAAGYDPDPGQGAEALTDGSWYLPAHDVSSALTKDGPLIPETAEQARNDRPEYYHDTKQGSEDWGRCHGARERTEPIGCVYGDPDGEFDLWLVGSSKTGQWADPLVEVAEREGWRVTIHTKSSCAFLPGLEVLDYPQCDTFNDAVLDLVDERDPDLVAFAPTYNEPASPTTPAEQDQVIADLLAAGAGHVAVLWESPGIVVGTSAVDCLDDLPANYQECSYQHEPGGIQVLNEAAQARALRDDQVSFVDLEPWVCPDNDLGACPGVIGGVQVTGVASHITTSYAKTLADPIAAQLYRAGIVENDPSAPTYRHAGADRYETAARLALEGNPRDVDTVYLATGVDAPDALAAGSRAGEDRLLLTRQGSLPAPTRDALRQLAPDRVILVGGTSAISGAVAEQVRDTLPRAAMRRVAGTDRYETTAKLAEFERGDSSLTRVFVTSGNAWADAVSVGGVARAGDWPLLLTQKNHLPSASQDALVATQPAEVVIVGGETVVSSTVEARLRAVLPDADVRRVAGDNRYETSADLARAYGDPDATSVLVATGLDFPDALAAGQGPGHGPGGPVLLTQPDHLPRAVVDVLESREPATAVVMGGTQAISSGVFEALRAVI
nr:cell wall-binding repeat-containing protein [Ornithinimicrobium sp. HY1793]